MRTATTYSRSRRHINSKAFHGRHMGSCWQDSSGQHTSDIAILCRQLPRLHIANRKSDADDGRTVTCTDYRDYTLASVILSKKCHPLSESQCMPTVMQFILQCFGTARHMPTGRHAVADRAVAQSPRRPPYMWQDQMPLLLACTKAQRGTQPAEIVPSRSQKPWHTRLPP
jgi:hypothetical protein